MDNICLVSIYGLISKDILIQINSFTLLFAFDLFGFLGLLLFKSIFLFTIVIITNFIIRIFCPQFAAQELDFKPSGKKDENTTGRTFIMYFTNFFESLVKIIGVCFLIEVNRNRVLTRLNLISELKLRMLTINKYCLKTMSDDARAVNTKIFIFVSKRHRLGS